MKNNVILLAAVALIAGFSGCSKKDNPAPQKPTKDMAGCQGYASGYANSGIVGAANTFDFKISQNNQFFAEEVGIQRGFWNGIPAEVHVLYEPAEDYRNAYASPDGKILFGYEMFYYLVRSFSKISGSNNLSPLPVAAEKPPT